MRIVGDREYAEQYIYWTVENLYVIPYVKINSETTLNLKEEHLETYSVTKEDVWSCAISNMDGKAKLLDASDIYSENIIDIFENQDDFDPEKPTLYALISDKGENFDAGYMLLDSVHRKLQKLFPAGYYIIPSSTNDSVVIPNHTDIKLALEVILSVNDEQVDPIMTMPNNAYVYENGTLRLVA